MKVAASQSAGDFATGTTITLSVNFSEAITVENGTPTLALNDNGAATYLKGSGSNTLIFSYTVSANDVDEAALAVTGIVLNGSTIQDGAGNNADFASLPTTFSGIQIDTTSPTAADIVGTPSSGDLNAGHTVSITLSMSEAVALHGAPTLSLNDGGNASYVPSLSHPSSGQFVFHYLVGSGQNIADLQVTGVNLPSGASVKDLAGNAADFSGVPGLANANLGLVIDTTAPTVTAVTSTPNSGAVRAGQAVVIDVTVSEAVEVTGAPILTLSDKGKATYDAANSDPANGKLEFDYIVGPKDNTLDLKAVALTLGKGVTVTDLAGNALQRTGACQTPTWG